jgi:hypothetical protein
MILLKDVLVKCEILGPMRETFWASLLRAQICTKVNFDMSCGDFNKYVITDKELIKSTKSSNKYSFLNQSDK